MKNFNMHLRFGRLILIGVVFSLLLAVPGISSAARSIQKGAVPPFLNYKTIPDMSDFDPNHPVIPHGDTIKIAIVSPFSGPAAAIGQADFIMMQCAAHAVNKRGGIFVDGKKKLVEIIKADNMMSPDATKKVCERMVLKEKVHIFVSGHGSHLVKIVNQVATKYNIISVVSSANSDELMDATNFTRNAFMLPMSISQVGRAFAYFYGQQRKKEKKFYILCQDYSFGRGLAESFKQGLKEYYPDAQIVGEDYHKLFLTDYAPYLTKIKASGAEVIFTGDWQPDAGNLLKQARQMGVMLPFANLYMTDPLSLSEVGIEGTEGLVSISQYGRENPAFKTKDEIKYFQTWQKLWKTWEPPYNSVLYQWPLNDLAVYQGQVSWIFSVLSRAKSTDPEKIIKVWEGDTYEYLGGKFIKMRACDHKAIQDLHIYEYVRPEKQKINMNIPPYYYYKTCSCAGPVWTIPAEKIMPWIDPKLDRCKGKNVWGE
jgi:branched-chain amino acid transport system substrate-binding protein